MRSQFGFHCCPKKKFIFFMVACLFILHATYAQVKWIGSAGDGQWGSAANWIEGGSSIVPVLSSDVILDNSFVYGNYSVTLPSSGTTVINSILISPDPGNTITLILPSSNISNPGFSVTGTTGDVFVLNRGAVFQNSSGVASGSSFAIAGTFRINNGGHYIHNALGMNASIVSQLSTVAGTESGIFEFKVPGAPAYTISASGRIYGTLVLSTTGGSKTYTVPTAVNPLTIKGDFIINANANFTWSDAANIIVNGNLYESSSSVINLSTGTSSPALVLKGNAEISGVITETGTGTPVIEMNGSANQNIAIAGSLVNTIDIKVNNSGGVSLSSPATIPATLFLVNGKIKTDIINILTFPAGATVVGGSSVSFVEGPVKKIGNTDFVFPIGKGAIYAPLTITNVSGESSTDVFVAEYKRQNPNSSIGNTLAGGIHHISYVEYWSLQQTGSSIKKISLQVNAESFCKDMSRTYVSHYDGVQWTNEATIIANGPLVSGMHQTGVLQSAMGISSQGYYTLATDLPFAGNALPVTLLSFEAIQTEPSKVKLYWNMPGDNLTSTEFVVQRKVSGRGFSDIGRINTTGTDMYTYWDYFSTNDPVYYRLKMIDKDGVVAYSKTLLVENKKPGINVNLFPTIVSSSEVFIEMSSPKALSIQCEIFDLQGKSIRKWNERVNKGTNRFSFTVAILRPGIYYFVVTMPDRDKMVRKFIRQ